MTVRALFSGVVIGVDFGFGESKSFVSYWCKGKFFRSADDLAKFIRGEKYRRRYDRRRKK